MKAITISAPSSGSGKTTVSLGLIRALKIRGLDVCAYKTGPDYIDRAFLEVASDLPVGNLDLHLQTQAGLNFALSKAPAEYCVIEGVMGFFDGISNTFQNSGYDICRRLKLNSCLVYTPKGEMFSAIPKIMGMANFHQSAIKSVLFNNITPRHYHLLKDALENNSDISTIGYLPKLKNATFNSRHLGLVQSSEISDLNLKLDEIAKVMEDTVNLDVIIDLMAPPCISTVDESFSLPPRNISVGIAKDQAFSFYYRENIELLENACRVHYFSPLNDKKLPQCDLLYFGGGYPEVFREQLSRNTSMLSEVRDFGENDGFILAECGGLMYLTEFVENSKMVGLLKGKCRLTSQLQRFGYVDVTLKEDCFLGKQGTQFTGHEFHKSVTTVDYPTLYQVSKTMGNRQWSCGFQYKNTIAGYPHINFIGHIQMINHLLKTVEKKVNTL